MKTYFSYYSPERRGEGGAQKKAPEKKREETSRCREIGEQESPSPESLSCSTDPKFEKFLSSVGGIKNQEGKNGGRRPRIGAHC